MRVGACSKKIEAPLGAIEAEAKASELGLQFAKDMSIHDSRSREIFDANQCFKGLVSSSLINCCFGL